MGSCLIHKIGSFRGGGGGEIMYCFAIWQVMTGNCFLLLGIKCGKEKPVSVYFASSVVMIKLKDKHS